VSIDGLALRTVNGEINITWWYESVRVGECIHSRIYGYNATDESHDDNLYTKYPFVYLYLPVKWNTIEISNKLIMKFSNNGRM
jgi:hypothetical protein